MDNKLSAGFTLIELLVVISIIGILASITLVSIQSVRAKARDTRRQADMQQIYNALYSFYLTKGCLPTPGLTLCATDTQADLGAWDYSSQGGSFLPFLVSSGYLSSVPVDPINNMTGDASPSGTYAYRYYCYNTDTGVGTGLALHYWSESTGGVVYYSGLRRGDYTDFADSNFVCR